MINVLCAGSYRGTFRGTDGTERAYEKVMLTYTENGNYPKIVGVNPDVYQDALQQNDGKPLSKAKEVKFFREERYGKYPVAKIEVTKE